MTLRAALAGARVGRRLFVAVLSPATCWRSGHLSPRHRTQRHRTWHRTWLARQQFDHIESELAFGDYLGTVDAAAARRAALAERLSRPVQESDLWPTLVRLRAFRGIDTLTALGLHLELGGDWTRFERASQLSAWLGHARKTKPDRQAIPLVAPRTAEAVGKPTQAQVTPR